MIPLSMATLGVPFTIQRVSGQDKIKKHLKNLGLLVGDQVTVITKLDSNLIIKVKEARIAVDKSIANRVMV